MKGKRLYRSRENAMLAGVCGGIGEFFDIDPTIVRLAWVILGFCGGVGIWACVIAAVMIFMAGVNGSYGAANHADKLARMPDVLVLRRASANEEQLWQDVSAVAEAAERSGVARRPITDYGAYRRWLATLIDRENRYMSDLMLHQGHSMHISEMSDR